MMISTMMTVTLSGYGYRNMLSAYSYSRAPAYQGSFSYQQYPTTPYSYSNNYPPVNPYNNPYNSWYPSFPSTSYPYPSQTYPQQYPVWVSSSSSSSVTPTVSVSEKSSPAWQGERRLTA